MIVAPPAGILATVPTTTTPAFGSTCAPLTGVVIVICGCPLGCVAVGVNVAVGGGFVTVAVGVNVAVGTCAVPYVTLIGAEVAMRSPVFPSIM